MGKRYFYILHESSLTFRYNQDLSKENQNTAYYFLIWI